MLDARIDGEVPEFVERLGRLDSKRTSAVPLATFGPTQILPSDEVDRDEANRRHRSERDRLRGEVKRAEGKLANEKFVAGAPDDVVAAEREKLERYRAELDELG